MKFSDEATVHLGGNGKRQNSRYWENDNPNWTDAGHVQNGELVNDVGVFLGRSVNRSVLL
jgi:hypothetical protein